MIKHKKKEVLETYYVLTSNKFNPLDIKSLKEQEEENTQTIGYYKKDEQKIFFCDKQMLQNNNYSLPSLASPRIYKNALLTYDNVQKTLKTNNHDNDDNSIVLLPPSDKALENNEYDENNNHQRKYMNKMNERKRNNIEHINKDLLYGQILLLNSLKIKAHVKTELDTLIDNALKMSKSYIIVKAFTIIMGCITPYYSSSSSSSSNNNNNNNNNTTPTTTSTKEQQ